MAGTYLELNPVKIDLSNRTKVTVYFVKHIFKQPAPDTIEQPGSFYFPPLGALITSGGRLLLAMIGVASWMLTERICAVTLTR